MHAIVRPGTNGRLPRTVQAVHFWEHHPRKQRVGPPGRAKVARGFDDNASDPTIGGVKVLDARTAQATTALPGCSKRGSPSTCPLPDFLSESRGVTITSKDGRSVWALRLPEKEGVLDGPPNYVASLT
jgi:hypothetical protein